MRKIATVLAAATVAGALLPASAYAAEPHHARHHYRHHAYHHRYERAPAYVNDQAYYAQRPVYAATGLPSDPLLYPIGGAVIGAIIGAAVCPPCAIAGSALTSARSPAPPDRPFGGPPPGGAAAADPSSDALRCQQSRTSAAVAWVPLQ